MRALFLSLMFAVLAGYQDPIPVAKLKELKAATVLIRQIAGSGSTAGPGFVFHRTPTHSYIAACGTGLQGSGIRSFQVFFNSGEPDERKVSADLVGEDVAGSLVVLQIPTTEAPAAIPLPARLDVKETQPLWILGYSAA